MKPNKIVIKTEKVVEQSLGIKQETQASTPNTMPNKPESNINAWPEEKRKLIDKIVQLKSENQECVLNVKKSEDQLKAMTSANQDLQTKLSRCDKHLKESGCLRADLSKANLLIKELKANNNKQVAELIRERDLSQAQLKQLKNTIEERNQENDEGDDNDGFYEVECLLSDKKVEKRAYLVRWKGFGSSHDSWILESELQCKEILKKYKQSKNGKKQANK